MAEERPTEVLGRLYLAHLIRRADPMSAAMHVEAAREIVMDNIREGSQDWRQRVELAAVQASSGETSAALDSIRDAVSRGWRDAPMLALNPLFQPLRKRAEFRALSDDIRARVAAERRALAEPLPPF